MLQEALKIVHVPFSRVGMLTDLTLLFALCNVQFHSSDEFILRDLSMGRRETLTDPLDGEEIIVTFLSK
jgi:hypothetical protein